MEEKEEIYSLIVRYLAQQTSLEENEQLADWLSLSEENELEFEQIKTIWLTAAPLPVETDDTTEALAKTKSRYQIPSGDDTTVKPVRRLRSARSWYYGAAAAVILVLGTLFLLMQQPTPVQEQPIAYLEQVTQTRQKLKLRLTDSSVVYLGPESKIRYPERFSGDSREVYLEGEAFFEVKRDTLHPFLVHSGQLTTRVLGTTFNVKAFNENPDIRVSLFSGKVEVFDTLAPRQLVVLRPGEQVRFDRAGRQLALATFNEEAVKGWVSNKLVFRNMPLGEAVHSIERFYGVTFVLEDPRIADTQLWASFNNEPLDSILGYLKLAGNIQYRRKGDIIYLIKKK